MTLLAALFLTAAVLVRGPWLLFLGVLLMFARVGRTWGPGAAGLVLGLLGVEVLSWWLERRGRTVAPWVTMATMAGAVLGLVTGLGTILGTAVAALAPSLRRLDDFKVAWHRLVRTVQVRAGRFVLGLLLILVPWPH